MLSLDLKQYEPRVCGPRRLAPRREKLTPIGPGSVAEVAAQAISFATGVTSSFAAAWAYERFKAAKRKKLEKKTVVRNGLLIETEVEESIAIRRRTKVRLTHLK
jgi:hypothetical protein